MNSLNLLKFLKIITRLYRCDYHYLFKEGFTFLCITPFGNEQDLEASEELSAKSSAVAFLAEVADLWHAYIREVGESHQHDGNYNPTVALVHDYFIPKLRHLQVNVGVSCARVPSPL